MRLTAAKGWRATPSGYGRLGRSGRLRSRQGTQTRSSAVYAERRPRLSRDRARRPTYWPRGRPVSVSDVVVVALLIVDQVPLPSRYWTSKFLNPAVCVCSLVSVPDQVQVTVVPFRLTVPIFAHGTD